MAKKTTRKKTTRKAASKNKQKPRKTTRKPKILTTEQIARASVKGARKLLVEFNNELGNEVLRQRRTLGLPDPDGEAFGKQLLRWQLALMTLTIAAGEEGFNPNHIGDSLLEALRNPVTGAKPTPWEVARWANTLYGEALQIIRDEIGLNDSEEEPEAGAGADSGAGAGSDGSDPDATDGSDPDATEGSGSHATEGSDPDATEGSGSHAAGAPGEDALFSEAELVGVGGSNDAADAF